MQGLSVHYLALSQGISYTFSVGLAVFLIYWRGFNRKALFLYVFITVGSSVILVTHNQPGLTPDASSSLSPILIRHKRQADVSTATPDVMTNNISSTLGLPLSNETMITKPKKPQVVEGIKAVETKSDKNEQMRKAIALNKTTSPPNVTSSLSLGKF
ncbi:unnamed protein product [Cylicostephanus goldi]|uniref:Uncharacterized protein n=1 Tax=Cylicostephanus goldi TaxID=71465 RepID=A0A3P6QLF7_CYLGO|nr:unnamed protein product [Cylicostephanus goldi]